jgi:hypothetical protein
MSFDHGTAETPKQQLNVAQCMAYARQHAGKSYAAMVSEMYSLSRGFGKLTAEDYFYYRLYDDRKFDLPAKQRFLSDNRHSHVVNRCNDPQWYAMADDKVAANIILRGYPLPNLQAVFSPVPRVCGAPVMTDAEALADFLREGARYPLFAKPIFGVQSRGAWQVDGHDKSTDRLLKPDGHIPVAEFARQIATAPGDGYMFQDLLKLHPDLAAVCGNLVSTMRLVILQPDSAPRIMHTLWKIRSKANVADNFWRPGNMLAQIDTDSGRVLRVVQGVGPSQVELENHPETGKRLLGLAMPDWDRTKAMVLECAQIFPKLRYHSWDIAPTPSGPVIVEINTGGAFALPQVAEAKGILSDEFRDFLKFHKC